MTLEDLFRLDWRAHVQRVESPRLANDEPVSAEVRYGDMVAYLTDRRIVVALPGRERSVPLARVTAVELGFERAGSAIAWLIVAILAAVLVLYLAGPLAGYLLAKAAGLESLVRQEGTEPGALGGLVLLVQRALRILSELIDWLPILAWIAIAWIGFRIYRASRGTTRLVVFASGEQTVLERNGRDPDLQHFTHEILKRFPRGATEFVVLTRLSQQGRPVIAEPPTPSSE